MVAPARYGQRKTEDDNMTDEDNVVESDNMAEGEANDGGWHAPLRLISAASLSSDTGQTPGMVRREAVSARTVGSQKVWMGETTVAARTASSNHHHGDSETGIYVVSGSPVFVFVEGGREVRLAPKPGDYVFVPPYSPHREENPSDETAVVVLARSSQEAIVVNLDGPLT